MKLTCTHPLERPLSLRTFDASLSQRERWFPIYTLTKLSTYIVWVHWYHATLLPGHVLVHPTTLNLSDFATRHRLAVL
jgi:hypothetical protein